MARWFDPSLGRFTSPDSIVPTSTQGTQAWDRYAFVNNNPVRYNDPTGHGTECGVKGTDPCPGDPPPSTSSTKTICEDPDAENYGAEGSCVYLSKYPPPHCSSSMCNPNAPSGPIAACFQGAFGPAVANSGMGQLCAKLVTDKIIGSYFLYGSRASLTVLFVYGQPVIVIGYSAGGNQAYAQAADAGINIQHLILIDPVDVGDGVEITKPSNVDNMYLLMASDGTPFTDWRYSSTDSIMKVFDATHFNILYSGDVYNFIASILSNP